MKLSMMSRSGSSCGRNGLKRRQLPKHLMEVMCSGRIEPICVNECLPALAGGELPEALIHYASPEEAAEGGSQRSADCPPDPSLCPPICALRVFRPSPVIAGVSKGERHGKSGDGLPIFTIRSNVSQIM